MELLQLYGLEMIGEDHTLYRKVLNKEKSVDELLSLKSYMLKVCGLEILDHTSSEIMEDSENYDWMIAVINKDRRELLFEEGELILTYIYFKTKWNVSRPRLIKEYLQEHKRFYKYHLGITSVLSTLSKHTRITSTLSVNYQI